MLGGNLLVHQLPELLAPLACMGLVVSAAILGRVMGSLLPLAVVIGFVWTSFVAANRLDYRLSPADDGRDFVVAGWVDDIPDQSSLRTRFSLRIDTATENALIDRRIRLSWYDSPPEIKPGDRFSLTVRLRQPRGMLNPASFDYERWLFEQDYSATGYVREGSAIPVVSRPLGLSLLRWRAEIAEQLMLSATNSQAGALIAALTVGVRHYFSDTDWAIFRRTGTSHLVAISGLHIGLFAGFGFLVVSFVARCFSSRLTHVSYECAICGSIVFALSYSALAGFSLPTLRALCMVVFAAMIAISRRQTNPMNGLAVSAVLFVLMDPLATLSASFWLSFAAVFCLIVYASQYRQVTGAGLRNKVQHALSLQAVITLSLAPLGAIFFSGVSLAAIPVNLIAIPVFTFVMIPVALLHVMAVAVLDYFWLLQLSERVAAILLDLLERVSAIDWAYAEVVPVNSFSAILATIGIALALPWHCRSRIWFGCIAISLLFMPLRVALLPGQARITVLDVGHGLAISVETARYALLFDTGPRSLSGFNIGAEVVLPYLRTIREPQTLIVSHGDTDHSGGFDEIRMAFPNSDLLHGPDIESANGRVCVAGMRWVRDGVSFEILHPQADFIGTPNDGSCVLFVAAGGLSALITGDIERSAEARLVANFDLSADVVIVPHHGSTTSSSADFVAATGAQYAVASAAYGGRWNFPRPTIIDRWQDGGAKVLSTGASGAITIELFGRRPRVSRERLVRRHYWQIPPT